MGRVMFVSRSLPKRCKRGDRRGTVGGGEEGYNRMRSSRAGEEAKMGRHGGQSMGEEMARWIERLEGRIISYGAEKQGHLCENE